MTYLEFPTWDEWIGSLSAECVAAAMALRDRFAALDCPDPEGWARSEIEEGIAQLARWHFLHGLRETYVGALGDPQVLRNLGGGALLDGGADAGELARFVQGVVHGVVHDLLYRLGYGSDQEVDETPLGGTLPGWRLLEVDPDGELTGRPVHFLHESWG